LKILKKEAKNDVNKADLVADLEKKNVSTHDPKADFSHLLKADSESE